MNKVKAFFESELQNVEHVNNSDYCGKWISHKDVVDNAIVRCLGVTMFVQTIGVSYEEVAPLYDEYKAKLEKYYK